MTVRTRFAPSPTGSLHVGGARTALFCVLYARQRGGSFILRIEDTDQQRSSDESTLGILRDLRWLGLDWDEGPDVGGQHGPYYQSRRLDLYNKYIDELLVSGRAYEAFETQDELDAIREASKAATGGFHYRRHAADTAAKHEAEGRTGVVRLVAPTDDITVSDKILGDVVMPAADFDDFVLRKADGFPTYHFAVVIDDWLMHVTDVLRGQEHLMNTPKHIAIFDALGWKPPSFGHLPLIFNPQGGKMSKRDKAHAARAAVERERDSRAAQGLPVDDSAWLADASNLTEPEIAAFMAKEHDLVSVAGPIAAALGVDLPMIEVLDFRRGGYLPEALINYLVLLGWNPGDDREILTFDEMVSAFDLARVNNTAARFDPDKLRWMNGETIRRSPIERLQEALALWLDVVDSPIERLTATQRRSLLEMYQPRITTFVELERMARFFLVRPTAWEKEACQKHLLKGGGVERLAALSGVIRAVEDWSAAGVVAALEQWSAETETAMGKVAQPLRVAVSGGSVSPGIGETLAFFSKDEVLRRIDDCLSYVHSHGG